MPRNRKGKSRVVRSRQGTNLVTIAGLPTHTLAWITRRIERDTSIKSARFVGAPSPVNDWGELYKKNLREILTLIERESRSLSPNRIIVLYVPSGDQDSLVSALGSVCFLAPLTPEDGGYPLDGNVIGWRHIRSSVENTVYRTLKHAIRVTNALKAEITDKRISVFTLPAHNFYYPDRRSTISDLYNEFAQRRLSMKDLKHRLPPSRFSRDDLPDKAFKGQQHTDEFFQDCQGRIFPPDLFHAPNRYDDEEALVHELSVSLRQRYRFGVTVRDGNLHYDVQYKKPRRLRQEPMYCSVKGNVWVTGSHANIGVNDVIWAPDGKIESKRPKK